MNFFDAQDKCRRKTAILVFFFICAVLAVIASMYAAATFIIYKTSVPSEFNWFNLKLLLIIGGGTLAIIFLGSITKIVALSKGGSYVAESLGGRLIPPGTPNADERKLLNVVEEMAIASGVPVPQVYIMDNEKGINAFAAGYSPNDAVVAVTRGCAEQLTRDELQGVVAHEFSHILNGDMRLNIQLIGLLSGIMLISSIGRVILQSGSRVSRFRTRSSSRSGGQIYLLALILLVIGYIGFLMGRLIQSAISRQREFLADASAVQFTRNPRGIANALKKIAGFSFGSKINSPGAEEACHMFFSKGISSIFSTHPPITERIRRIDPEFSGEFETGAAVNRGGATGFASAAASWEAVGAPVSMMAADASDVIGRAGNVTSENISRGNAILDSVPERIKEEAGGILGATAIVCALLLSRNDQEKAKQTELLAKSAPETLLRHVQLLDRAMTDLDPGLRLPLLDLVLPILRSLSPDQYNNLKKYIKILAEADSRISIFEFALYEVIAFRVEAALNPKKAGSRKIKFKSMKLLIDDCTRLLSVLADAGQNDHRGAEEAFKAGLAVLPVKRQEISMLPAGSVPFKELHTALTRFSESSPGVKKAVFEACVHCVLYDGKVTVKEAELLRAIAYSMDIPLPPFLNIKPNRQTAKL